MQTSKLTYLKAMGIQPWQLKHPTGTPLLIIQESAECTTTRSRLLLDAILETLNFEVTLTHLENPDLEKQMASATVLLATGNKVAQFFSKNASLENLRQIVHIFKNKPLIVTYDTEHLFQHPRDKSKAFQDLQLVQRTILKN